MRSAVGIIFQPLDDSGNTVLVAQEIDQAVALLVAAADVARGLTAHGIAGAGAILLGSERCDRSALCRCERSILTTKRVPGEVGFILMSAITLFLFRRGAG